MRIHFDGKGTALPPDLLGNIAERLEVLNTPEADIFEARVTLKQIRLQRKPHYATRVELLLVGRTLCVMHEGTTPHDAVNAAMADIACQLLAFRMLRPQVKTPRPRLHQRQAAWVAGERLVGRRRDAGKAI